MGVGVGEECWLCTHWMLGQFGAAKGGLCFYFVMLALLGLIRILTENMDL